MCAFNPSAGTKDGQMAEVINWPASLKGEVSERPCLRDKPLQTHHVLLASTCACVHTDTQTIAATYLQDNYIFQSNKSIFVLFLQLLHIDKRREYLYQLQEFLVTDNSRNWRFRAELAE